MGTTYKAIVIEKLPDGQFARNIKERLIGDLPDNEVLIKVHYSALNYKDALSATGNKGVTQNYPHTPGIDAAGIIVKSKDQRFLSGDKVLVTGFDLGMNTPGGFGEYIQVPGKWIVPLPRKLTLRESMMIGTAGFTAALGIYKIKNTMLGTSQTKTALVTGATGGVASLAISILHKNGFKVIAATGKPHQKKYLKKIGATEVIHRDEIFNDSKKPLLPRRWDVAFETVGGDMLDAVLRQTQQNGTVACCGNILGDTLETSVYPFILRGINLVGVNSATCFIDIRKRLWELLAKEWKPKSLDVICRECTLEGLDTEIENILNGEQVGKVLVAHG